MFGNCTYKFPSFFFKWWMHMLKILDSGVRKIQSKNGINILPLDKDGRIKIIPIKRR